MLKAVKNFDFLSLFPKKQMLKYLSSVFPKDISFLKKLWYDFIRRETTGGEKTDFSTPDAVKKLAAPELDIAVLMNHKARFLSVKPLLRAKILFGKRR